VLVSGSVRIKLEDECPGDEQWDAVRVHRDTVRGFEAGDAGAELIAFGAPNTGRGRRGDPGLVGASNAPLLELFPIRPPSRTASSSSAAHARPRSHWSSGRRCSVSAGILFSARARAYARAEPEALVATGRRRSRTSRCCGCSPRRARRRRVHAGRARVRARAGVSGERLVFHGNNKSDEELRRPRPGALVVLDALEEVERARRPACAPCSSASRPGSRPRRTTRSAPRTRSRSSGCRRTTRSRPSQTPRGRARRRGLHVHIGSQLLARTRASSRGAARRRGAALPRTGTPRSFNLGGGLGVRTRSTRRVPHRGVRRRARAARARSGRAGAPDLEPGRSLIGRPA
jgi:hypothetical protein